jgi:transcriptional regulator with PAS, ATPase and Fis domain
MKTTTKPAQQRNSVLFNLIALGGEHKARAEKTVTRALRKAANASLAAAELGVSRASLYRLMRSLEIPTTTTVRDAQRRGVL